MPTKRSRLPADGLPLPIIDWLLEGAPRRTDDTDPLRSEGSGYDSFLEFDEPRPDLRGLWHRHRRALLDEWRRRGGAGLPWAAKEFDQ